MSCGQQMVKKYNSLSILINLTIYYVKLGMSQFVQLILIVLQTHQSLQVSVYMFLITPLSSSPADLQRWRASKLH